MSEALIIVDVQNDYFPDGNLPTCSPIETAEACAKLIEKFRKEKKEVIYVQHILKEEDEKNMKKNGIKPFLVKDTKGSEIHDIVKPLANEKIIIKHEVSGFVRTNLKEYLISKGIKKLIVVGMMIHNCVNATVYSGVDEGFDCIVVEEAVNTMDQNLHDELIKAELIKKSFLAGIQFVYSKVYKLNDVLNNKYEYKN
jgi:nicotinamidase-related amidase